MTEQPDLVKQIETNLIQVLREFGPVGLITYVGGLIILISFFLSNDFNKQVLFSITGIVLILLSVTILALRIQKQWLREKSLVDMVTFSSNRLAEKINENVQKEQVTSITQTIWQTQKDLIGRILKDDLR